MALASSSSGTLLDLRAIFCLSVVVVAAAEGAVATGGAGEGAIALTGAGAGAGASS